MNRLDTRSARLLSEILLDLYAPVDLRTFRTNALAIVARLFGCEMVCHNEICLSSGDSLSVLSRPVDGFEVLRPAFFAHVHEHPSITHLLECNGEQREAVRTSDFVSQIEFRERGIYREFYQKLGIRYQLTIGAKIDERMLFFAISRENKDFTQQERAILTLLRPHFLQAYQQALDRSPTPTQTAPSHRLLGLNGRGDLGRESAADIGLTRRESEVLRWIAEGKMNDEIATILGVSVHTVKSHVARILERLGVETRTAAAARAFELFAR